MVLRSVRICSLHDLPERNPPVLALMHPLYLFLFSSKLQKTFPGTNSSVIPLQLLQSLRHPFFGSGTIIPCLQSFGISSVDCMPYCSWVEQFIIFLLHLHHHIVAILLLYNVVFSLLTALLISSSSISAGFTLTVPTMSYLLKSKRSLDIG